MLYRRRFVVLLKRDPPFNPLFNPTQRRCFICFPICSPSARRGDPSLVYNVAMMPCCLLLLRIAATIFRNGIGRVLEIYLRFPCVFRGRVSDPLNKIQETAVVAHFAVNDCPNFPLQVGRLQFAVVNLNRWGYFENVGSLFRILLVCFEMIGNQRVL